MTPCNRSRRHALQNSKTMVAWDPHFAQEVSKLMIPTTGFSAEIKNKSVSKRWHYTETIWLRILAQSTAFLLISTVPRQTQFDLVETKNFPCLTWRRNWWWKRDLWKGDIYSRRRERWSSPLPHFSFDYKKCRSLSFQGMAPSCPPTYKPHKPAIVVNNLSITLSLAECFLSWDKRTEGPWSPQNTT